MTFPLWVVVAAGAFLAAVAWKFVDQRRDDRQAKMLEISRRARELGFDFLPRILDAYAIDDHEEIVLQLKILYEQLTAKDGVENMTVDFYFKTLSNVLDNPLTKHRLQPLFKKHEADISALIATPPATASGSVG